MKQFVVHPVTLVLVLASVLTQHVKCITNSKPGTPISGSFSSSTESSQQLKDLKTDGTSSFWSPHPEYYHERDRYNRPDKTDFVTSYGNHDGTNKYGSGSLSSPYGSYGNKDRLGYNSPSTGSGGTYYSPGGVFDQKYAPYGPPQPVDFPTYGHGYESHPDYNPHGYGYSLGNPYSGKDLAKSFLLPLAGAALIGLAAALVFNPALLHLGVAAVGKRKRRDVTTNAHDLAYRAWLLKPPTPTTPST
ncbi:uncharacterized protein LOC129725884 [Wyeomyia smithii]|uniref:uncharacterized protein LOC129725884 n=1 Tax=Wyeomyia smithii TaxID=174621 RepID=UPI0024680756|nr:uncharacterized protein LOC129725884 [Wyeomyia smithii]